MTHALLERNAATGRAVRYVERSASPTTWLDPDAPPRAAGADASRIVTYVASDESVDRYGDIIKVSGWQLDNYKRNPVVLFGHEDGMPPIGRAARVWKGRAVDGRRALMIDVEYAPAEASPQAEVLYQLSTRGFLNAVSVGFLPTKPPRTDFTPKEREALGLGDFGVVYDGQDLLEVSLVSVPANPSAVEDALDDMVRRGVSAAAVDVVRRSILAVDPRAAAVPERDAAEPVKEPAPQGVVAEERAPQSVAHTAACDASVVSVACSAELAPSGQIARSERADDSALLRAALEDNSAALRGVAHAIGELVRVTRALDSGERREPAGPAGADLGLEGLARAARETLERIASVGGPRGSRTTN